MAFILGIDTGGAYTDGAVIDADTKEVLFKAKALTTKHDLTEGICNCIDNLNFNLFDQVVLVSLSTTLATNTIVEGKGCPTGLILIGGKPSEKIPTKDFRILRGKLDIKGDLQVDMSEKEAFEAIESLRGKVESVAISGYASVRNPVQELKIKEMVNKQLGIPVVCAHELTSKLGFQERTVTAVLDASLIPVIKEMINSVKTVLERKNVEVPIMIVKGDGNLMSEGFATQRPIETIMSGPAASIIGGKYLSGKKDAAIVDMGSTTTDIASVSNGLVKVNQEGANVGGWMTRVRSADISTFGIGGDSHIRLDSQRKLILGPQKATPLCVAGIKFPNLIQELNFYRKNENYKHITYQTVDCFQLVKKSKYEIYSEAEEEVIEVLKEGPHSFFYLAEKLKIDINILELENLVNNGTIARISLTPTDVLHACGIYTEWNSEISKVAVEILSNHMEITPHVFIDKGRELVRNNLSNAYLQSISDFQERENQLLEVDCSFEKPIVAIGAPAFEWMKPVCKKLNANIIIPEHFEVANAIGAAVGQIMETVEILIRLDKATEKYVCYSPVSREVFDTLEEAKNFAFFTAQNFVVSIAEEMGSESYEVQESLNDVYADLTTSEKKVYVETRVKAVLIGMPSWKKI